MNLQKIYNYNGMKIAGKAFIQRVSALFRVQMSVTFGANVRNIRVIIRNRRGYSLEPFCLGVKQCNLSLNMVEDLGVKSRNLFRGKTS